MQNGSQRKPVGKPRGMRRDRDCRSCKLRGVKCDLNRPSCGECIKAAVPCGGYPQRVVWVGDPSSKDAASSSSSTSSSSARLKQSRASSRMSSERPSSLSLSQSQLQSLQTSPETKLPNTPSDASDTPVPTRADSRTPINLQDADQNSFIKPLVNLCQQIISLDGDALRRNQYLSSDAICLISRLRDFVQARIDGHKTCPSGDLWESEDAARYRLDALLGLKDALAVANPFAFIGIAAFAFFEVCDSGFGEWQRHLYGAKSLLDYHCKSREQLDNLSQSITGLAEMVARLVWFDICGAIVRGTTDLIFEDWHRQILNESFFGIVGCAGDTFDLLIRVTKGEVASDPLNSSILAMDQLLKLSLGLSDWDRATNASRCAAVIAVLSNIHDETPSVPKAATMSSAVDRTCQIIASMSPSSQFYIHMAVPAFLAGSNANATQQCDIIRAYWHNCNLGGVRRYPDALARCENRWKIKGLV
ncbi:hypothetical protein PT974_05321 [Cladobotryum mycophilum]|uniref:Zn(2)-C6 fungal-type domain-containing protein n=1 Tax=Cladobotryum mycophilum TaxID=491253 RepID=A0ABR0SIF3_9HYPO